MVERSPKILSYEGEKKTHYQHYHNHNHSRSNPLKYMLSPQTKDLMVHAELSQAEHAVKRTPSSARTT